MPIESPVQLLTWVVVLGMLGSIVLWASRSATADADPAPTTSRDSRATATPASPRAADARAARSGPDDIAATAAARALAFRTRLAGGATTVPLTTRAPGPATAAAARPTAPAGPSRGGGRVVTPPSDGRGFHSLSELRASMGRDFASMQQFAVAAVLEAGYPSLTIARLFRVPSWRLDAWVEQTLRDAERPIPAGRRLR